MIDTLTKRKTIEELLPEMDSFFFVFGQFPAPTGKWYIADQSHTDEGTNPGWTKFKNFAQMCKEKDADEWIAGLTKVAHSRKSERLQNTTFHKEPASAHNN